MKIAITGHSGGIGKELFKREHECEFVNYDETLINQLNLLELTGKDTIMKMGHVRWY